MFIATSAPRAGSHTKPNDERHPRHLVPRAGFSSLDPPLLTTCVESEHAASSRPLTTSSFLFVFATRWLFSRSRSGMRTQSPLFPLCIYVFHSLQRFLIDETPRDHYVFLWDFCITFSCIRACWFDLPATPFTPFELTDTTLMDALFGLDLLAKVLSSLVGGGRWLAW
ncbi:hypothetical protein OE88DRAFT_888456 [Heliocybe sulcata]|uniref:Uncharacterized protein n=1 Tax=Heliocybe sulcata TaxID=5364 RepID=A0A5C3MSI8_9AGAM|nr:hypothetical protein OE88DRAFT_888456 [Heliocybe sulcata]